MNIVWILMLLFAMAVPAHSAAVEPSFLVQYSSTQPDSAPADPQFYLVCIAIAAVIGLIVVGIMAAKMKTVRFQNGAANYIRSGSLVLTHSSDRFLYRTVNRTAKPQNNTSGRIHGR